MHFWPNFSFFTHEQLDKQVFMTEIKGIPTMIFTSLVLALSSCGVTVEAVEEATPEGKEIIFAVKGSMYGGGTEGFEEGGEAIYKEEDWNALKAKMSTVNPVSDEIANAVIDFQTEMIIVYIDKVQPSGGYEIHLERVLEFSDEIVVSGQKVSPKEGATSVLTQPYFILSTIKSKKPIRFELTQQ